MTGFAVAFCAAAAPLHAQAEPRIEYLGLHVGMPVAEAAELLAAESGWRERCRKAVSSSLTVTCTFRGESTRFEMIGTTFDLELDEAGEVVTQVLVQHQFQAREPMQQVIASVIRDWSGSIDMNVLNRVPCTYHALYESQTQVAKVSGYCQNRNIQPVYDDNSPVAMTMATVHLHRRRPR